MRITISGTAGSGKSTLAKMLAEKLGYKHYSMGDFQREIAREKGITIEKLGELEKKDPSIDKMVDDRQRNLGKKENNFVIDSWLSPLFIPDSFKIFITANIKVRAKRILLREPKAYKNIEGVIKKIKQREKTNKERWKKFYGFDFEDKKNYNLLIDSTDINAHEAFEIAYKKIKEN